VLDTTICVGHHYMQTNTHNVKKKIGWLLYGYEQILPIIFCLF
jgi:hypothetical protein